MIYLSKFTLQTRGEEENFFFTFKRTCFTNQYPFGFFPFKKELRYLEMSEVTILCGGNGSGKSTLLNIIAERLQLKRDTPYNKTYFFDPYVEGCSHSMNVYNEKDMKKLMSISRIITSDDVFNHIIKVRRENEVIDQKRQQVFYEKGEWYRDGVYKGPKGFSADDPESIREVIDYYDMTRMSASKFVRCKVGEEERTYSNGENGFLYFSNAIQPGGLYLLDEPENSLSPEMQLELTKLLYSMARFHKCQFIIATHSPFIMSIPYAKLYNMDEYPVRTCEWTEYENVRVYYEFFKRHGHEFEQYAPINNNV